MKLISMLLALALSSIIYVTMYDSEKEPHGFRGLNWGEENSQALSGFTLLAEEGELKFYERADDRMKLGDVPIEKLVYGFHKGRFYSVMMYFNSPDNFARSKEVLSRQYGEPYQPAQSEKKFIWDDEKLSVLLTFDDATNMGRVLYLFKPIENEMGEKAPADAKGASS